MAGKGNKQAINTAETVVVASIMRFGKWLLLRLCITSCPYEILMRLAK
jgi:hypothetical protein